MDLLSDIPCPTCGACALTIGERFAARRPSSVGLAGVMVKTTAVLAPWLWCACGAKGPVRVTLKPGDPTRVNIEVTSWSGGPPKQAT
jgi:hypothetical protein